MGAKCSGMGLQARARPLLVQLEEAIATDVGALALSRRRRHRRIDRLID